MTWKTGETYRTRQGETARFIGILDTIHKFQTHIFAVRGKTIPAVETVRMTDEDGRYGNNDKSYRPFDILNPEPSKAESKIIDRVIKAKPEKVKDVILEILRENR